MHPRGSGPRSVPKPVSPTLHLPSDSSLNGSMPRSYLSLHKRFPNTSHVSFYSSLPVVKIHVGLSRSCRQGLLSAWLWLSLILYGVGALSLGGGQAVISTLYSFRMPEALRSPLKGLVSSSVTLGCGIHLSPSLAPGSSVLWGKVTS